ncbi:MAG: hypothetical protein KY429_01270 [Actinobacteria bacterium]|nr:hypothetical protein [Actinomycetota bacterium]
MAQSLAVAVIATAAVLAAAAVGSPEWGRRREILASFRTKVEVDEIQGRSLMALAVFSAAAGVPSAIGLLPVVVLVPLGGLVVMSMVRHRLSRTSGGNDHAWLAVLGVCAIAISARFQTLDTEAILGAQAVLGPTLLVAPYPSALLAGLAAAAGFISCTFHVATAPAFTKDLAVGMDPLLRWLQTALAATVIAASVAGPSVAILSSGPFDLRMMLLVMASTIFLLVAVAGVSFARHWTHRIPERPALISCAVVAGLCLLAQPLT